MWDRECFERDEGGSGVLSILSLKSYVKSSMGILRSTVAQVTSLPRAGIMGHTSLCRARTISIPRECGSVVFLGAIMVVRATLAPSRLSTSVRGVRRSLKHMEANRHRRPEVVSVSVVAYSRMRSSQGSLALPRPRTVEQHFIVRPLTRVTPSCVVPGRDLATGRLLTAVPRGPSYDQVS